MICNNCGHKNDPDASFCEKCGADISKSSMPTSTKILIVVVIVLVAGLGLVSAMMLMNNQTKPITNNTTVGNNTTGANNNTGANNTATSSSTNVNSGGNNTNSTSQTQIISKDQALAIGESAMPGAESYSVNYYPSANPPQYIVNAVRNYGPGGHAIINAETGQIISTYT